MEGSTTTRGSVGAAGMKHRMIPNHNNNESSSVSYTSNNSDDNSNDWSSDSESSRIHERIQSDSDFTQGGSSSKKKRLRKMGKTKALMNYVRSQQQYAVGFALCCCCVFWGLFIALMTGFLSGSMDSKWTVGGQTLYDPRPNHGIHKLDVTKIVSRTQPHFSSPSSDE